MNTRKKIIEELGLILFHLVPFVYLYLVYGSLPDRVPTHFNLSGEPDDFSSKQSLFWILAGLNCLGYLLFLAIPYIDPKKMADSNPGIYRKIRIGMSVLFVGLSMLIVYMAGGDPLKGILLLALLFSGLCIFLGNYMQAVRSNYFIGIRTPWTLHSENNWRRTHRVTGRLLFYGGLLSIPLMFLLPPNLAPIPPVIALVGGCIFGLVYSFILYKKEKETAV